MCDGNTGSLRIIIIGRIAHRTKLTHSLTAIRVWRFRERRDLGLKDNWVAEVCDRYDIGLSDDAKLMLLEDGYLHRGALNVQHIPDEHISCGYSERNPG